MLTTIAGLASALLIGSSSPAVEADENDSAASSTPSLALAGDEGVLGLAGLGSVWRPPHDFAQSKAAVASIDHPLLPSECKDRFGSACYGPAQLRHLYGVDKLGPIDGAGRTVALIEPGHDPVLKHDLEVYSRQTGLPAPKMTIKRIGQPKELSPSDPVQAITAQELELDSQMVHTTAPGARIMIVETERDVANDFGGFGGAIDVIAKLSKLGVDAVSLSYGFFEPNYDEAYGPKAARVIRSQAAGLAVAARNHMTVVSANGDTGPTGPNLAGEALYPTRAAAWISTSPLVTAVAGTELHADDAGNRTRPDTVWGEHDHDQFATGGSISKFFTRPRYQDRARGIVGAHRGNADVAMDGSTASRVWMYTSRYQVLTGQKPGWVRTAGTSAASPLFAGIVADAAQEAGHGLGPINTALYDLARTPASRAAAGIADVTVGCNTISGGPSGFCARRGWDLPSGIGTVDDATRFVPALAARYDLAT